MKYLFLLLFVSPFSFASYSGPEVLARLNFAQAWNAPDNFFCFTSEPAILKNAIYLACYDEEGHVMARWNEDGFSIVAKAGPDQYFSFPQSSFDRVHWYEYNQTKAVKVYESAASLTVQELDHLGPFSDSFDSLLFMGQNSYLFRLKGESPELYLWNKESTQKFFSPGAAYIYSPETGPHGELALKTRDLNYDEESPDRLWLYDGEWKEILKDQDADPSSPWISFRHQLAVEGDKVLALAKDEKGEALILIQKGNIEVLAREGVDLLRFDYFSPKMRSGTIVVRGEDFDGKKVTFVKDEKGFRKLLSQGDKIVTDVGEAYVQYKDQNAIFYGAPGIDERGNIYLQATLTHAKHAVLLGVGIIKFTKQ